MSKGSSSSPTPEVFISVGRCSTAEQEQVVERVFSFVRKSGIRPLSEKHGDEWPTTGAIQSIHDVLKRASGTIVIAFERKHIERGRELRTAEINNELIPSVWNQIEAGMACAVGHPMLILMDQSIRQEGLLDRNFPWHIESVELANFDPHTEAFARTFSAFRQQLHRFAESREKQRKSPRGKRESLGEVLESFSLEQLKLMGSVGAATLAVVAGGAYWADQHFGR